MNKYKLAYEGRVFTINEYVFLDSIFGSKLINILVSASNVKEARDLMIPLIRTNLEENTTNNKESMHYKCTWSILDFFDNEVRITYHAVKDNKRTDHLDQITKTLKVVKVSDDILEREQAYLQIDSIFEKLKTIPDRLLTLDDIYNLLDEYTSKQPMSFYMQNEIANYISSLKGIAISTSEEKVFKLINEYLNKKKLFN